MASTPPKRVVSFRLTPDLIEWLEGYAGHFRMTRTALLEEMLTSLREGRLFTLPDSKPNPFPKIPRPEPIPVHPNPTGAGTYPHRKKESTHEN